MNDAELTPAGRAWFNILLRSRSIVGPVGDLLIGDFIDSARNELEHGDYDELAREREADPFPDMIRLWTSDDSSGFLDGDGRLWLLTIISGEGGRWYAEISLENIIDSMIGNGEWPSDKPRRFPLISREWAERHFAAAREGAEDFPGAPVPAFDSSMYLGRFQAAVRTLREIYDAAEPSARDERGAFLRKPLFQQAGSDGEPIYALNLLDALTALRGLEGEVKYMPPKDEHDLYIRIVVPPRGTSPDPGDTSTPTHVALDLGYDLKDDPTKVEKVTIDLGDVKPSGGDWPVIGTTLDKVHDWVKLDENRTVRMPDSDEWKRELSDHDLVVLRDRVTARHQIQF